MSKKKWQYGNGWEQFPIEPGEVWGVPANGSKVAVHDIFNPLPGFMFDIDLLFIDPPYNQGQLSSFYTKAFKADRQPYDKFTDVIFERLAQVQPKTCYIEIGNQFVDAWLERLAHQFPIINSWGVTYYGKNPCNLIRGSFAEVDYNFNGMDEMKCVPVIAKIEDYKVMGDFCMGQGLAGVSAYAAGKPFMGTELNKRRLANLLQKLHKAGAVVQKY